MLFVVSQQQQRIVIVFEQKSCLLDGTGFELQWMHSVERQQWVEVYELYNDRLLLTDTYFETFGAGVPSVSVSGSSIGERAHQSHLDKKYSGYIHYQVNQQLPYLNWMVSSNIKATIVNQNHVLPIYQWVSGGYTNIYIAPRKMTIWAQLLQESCHDYTPNHTDRISD
ncbi:DUF1850 domain-containing protein [Psychrobacter lutiphocae]|uniref:DUF1850 domain-containing protein n=1 Tax=Psychrobacter lutiphocae TaxID=540500 RepID=UPI001427A417|nr:DUF1850 domain-containing protein [Psychrobacter lutiphocae]